MAKSGSSRSSALRVAVLTFSAVLAIQGLIPPAPAAAKQLERLITVTNTNFVSAGVGGMRGSGSGSISLSGVTGPVTRALLYWNGPTDSDDAAANSIVSFAGNTITGANIGFSSSNCWNNPATGAPFTNSQSYRADVTRYVTGDGSYALSGFRKAGPPTVDINGASLIVFFNDPNSTVKKDVTIFDGNDSTVAFANDPANWSASLTGITYRGGGASLQLHVSDGQDFDDGALLLNGNEFQGAGKIFSGTSVPGATIEPNPPTSGNLWDIRDFPITSLMTTGTNDYTLTSSAASDCISLVVALVSVPTPITLTPVTGTKAIGTDHTLTATIAPPASRSVTLTVKSGPNVGMTQTKDTNPDTGQATFTYTSEVPGADTVAASFTESAGEFFTTFTSNDATVLWTGIAGVAQCVTTNGDGTSTTLLPGAAVRLFTGSHQLASTTADPSTNPVTAKYKFSGLVVAANATFNVQYTSADGTRSCGVTFVTDATGSKFVPPPDAILYRQNSTWLHPYELNPAPLGTGSPVADSVPSGKSRWYVLRNVPAQSQVNVSLTAAEVDLTLVAFRNVRAVATRLNSLTGSTTNVQQLTSSQNIGADDMAGDDMAGDDMAGDDMAGDDMAGDDMAGDDMAGDDMAGDDMAGGDIAAFANVYTTAQPPSVLALSATPGRAAEFLSINARAGGDVYFRVRKSVRELAPAEGHYNITATYVAAPGCNNLAAQTALAANYTASPIPSGITGKATLILTNTAGFSLAGTAKTDFLALLDNVAAKSYVNGVRYDLASNVGVMAAYNAWASSPDTLGCVALANRVTDVIKDVVNAFRQTNPIQYGVSAGGDRIIPLRRVLDRVPPPLKTEVQYSPPLAVGTADDASLAGNYYLTADFYPASAPITRFGGEVWLPEFSWGLLVETPADIKAYLDTFTAANGLVQNPGKALSMGFDWNADTAKAIADDIDATTAVTTRVINPNTATAAYTASDIKSNLTALWSTAGYLGVQGHASATSLKAADNLTHLYSTDLADIAAGQARTTGLVVTLGCHSAFNIQDSDVNNPLVQKLAWPEAFLAQGKTLLGGTGYQYAETVLIKNTERLLTLFTHELRFVRGMDAQGQPLVSVYPNGEVPLGAAHVNAKRLYMSELKAFTGLDQKVLGVSQLFGMPMLRYDLPGTVGSQRLERGAGTLLTPTAPDALGLSTANITQSFTLNRCNATGCSGVTSDPSYFAESPQLTQAVSFRPIIARNPTNVDAAGTVARGAVIMDARFTQTGATPLTVLPVTEQPGSPPAYVSPVFSPWPVALNEYVNQQLVWMPTQYRSNADGTSFDLNKFSAATTKIYYSNLTDTRALVDAPVIRDVRVSVSGNNVHLELVVRAHTNVGIKEVWATSLGRVTGGNCLTTEVANTGNANMCFVSQAMTGGTPIPDTDAEGFGQSRFLQTFTLDVDTGSPAGTLAWRGFFQAVGGNALVRLTNNLGALYRFVQETATATTPKSATDLVGSAPSSAVYRSFILASATLTLTGTTTPVFNEPVTFRLGSVARTALTDSNGVASVPLAVEVLPRAAPYRLLIGHPESQLYLATGVGLDITVTPAPTQFKLATTPIPAGSSGFLAKLCRSADTACIGSAGEAKTPAGINEHLVQIDIDGYGSVLTTTDGFGRILLDTLVFGGLAPGNYTGTITALANRLYLQTSAQISFSTAPQTFTKDRAVQGQGNFTLGSNSVGLAPGSPATFEFNVTLPALSATPNGKNLGFHVKAQNFDFVATSFDWMTIVGNRAIVAGRGTLTLGAASTPNVRYWMTVDDFATGDRYEIRIGGTFQSPQYFAASSVKNSAVTIK